MLATNPPALKAGARGDNGHVHKDPPGLKGGARGVAGLASGNDCG